ncbi:MAG: hypothetical protein EOP64_04855 [Sphingomonas sp.]|nr:MAG: hypothetical protein EOP64_04855 [Sphingomonas sp.]
MPATIQKLLSRPGQLRAEQAQRLRDALLPFEAEMPDQVGHLIGQIDRKTAARNGWTFVMLSPSQNAAVVGYLAEHSDRPIVAMRLWAMCFEYLRNDTGEIMLRRDEIAEKLKEQPDTVSRIMSQLEEIGAIIRRRERVSGMRGPGLVRYFMNSVVGTHLTGAARDKAQADAAPGPLLRLMEGGKAP